MRRLLQLPTADPPLLIDADLRPEGRQGPLVRTLASYAEYYRRWSVVWESQALLRAEPVAGDPDVGARFLEIANPLRWPDAGLDEASVREVRRIKARVEAERLPRGVDKLLHTKLGPGGLSDVEWTVQLIQLRHAHAVPALRTTRTRQALQAAVEAGLLDPADARILDEAWLEATRVRNGVTLVRGRPGTRSPPTPASGPGSPRTWGPAGGVRRGLPAERAAGAGRRGARLLRLGRAQYELRTGSGRARNRPKDRRRTSEANRRPRPGRECPMVRPGNFRTSPFGIPRNARNRQTLIPGLSRAGNAGCLGNPGFFGEAPPLCESSAESSESCESPASPASPSRSSGGCGA